jgi:hypothetical protein
MTPKRTTPPPPVDTIEHERWLDEIVLLDEGARLRGGVHVDTIKRAHAKGLLKLERISERRWGIRRRVALMK